MFGKLQEVNEKNRTFVLLLRIRGLGKELQGNINIDYKNYFWGFSCQNLKFGIKYRTKVLYLRSEAQIKAIMEPILQKE